MDTRELRNCLGRFATGVTIITSRREDGEPHGITVNAFTSVSLDPPLVLVSLDRKTRACRYLEGAPFVVNILRADQDDLAWHFAGRPKEGLELEWVAGEDGRPPRLADSLAWIECSPWRSYDGGDHVLYLGRVEKFRYTEGKPLIFYGGQMTEPAQESGHDTQATA